jgi:hypothetical protein
MLIQNTKQTSLCEALKRTFDGAHPCSLCGMVHKGKASDQKRDIQTPTAKIDIIYVVRPIRLLPRLTLFEYASAPFSNSEIEYSPPVPPPRSISS